MLKRAALYVATVFVAVSLVACGGQTSDTIGGPTAVVSNGGDGTSSAPPPAEAPKNVEATPDPNAVHHLFEYGDNASFNVKNLTAIGQEYRAYITNFDDQKTELAFKVSGTVPSNQTWGDSFNAQCVQLDITHSNVSGQPIKGGSAFFDKKGKQFKPSKNPEKVTECQYVPPQCKNYKAPAAPEFGGALAVSNLNATQAQVTAGTVSPSGGAFNPGLPATIGRPASFSTVYTISKAYGPENLRCVATFTHDYTASSTASSCSEQYPNPGNISGNGSKTVTKHPGQPEAAYWYWDMDNGHNNNEKQNACEGRGGVWLGDNYDIPNDGTNQRYDDVCRMSTGPAFPGGPGADVDFIKKVVVSPATSDKYSVSVSASFSVSAGSGGSYKFQIVWNGSTVKKEKSESLDCGEAFQGSLTWGQGDQYNNSPNYSAGDGHVTGSYALRVLRNNVAVSTTPLP